MHRGTDRQDRPARVGAAVLAKALLGVLIVFVCTSAGVAGAGYIQIGDIVPTPVPGSGPAPTPIPSVDPDPVEPGGPRTLLILGSDRRAKNSTDSKLGQEPHSDTIVLMRLDPKLHRIAVLSIPRDLAVTIPGYADGGKINSAYDEGGAALTLKTVKHLFESATGSKFPVNSVIDVNFIGFEKAVDFAHGVYVDVDRRYYNPAGTGYAAIDVNAGYQRLVGEDALAYVRYRHGDSDIYPHARPQNFPRQGSSQPPAQQLKPVGDAKRRLGVLQQYFRFDKKFMTRKNLAGLFKTAIYLA